MMKSRALLCIVYWLFFMVSVFPWIGYANAQSHYIEGHITDRITNEPIPFVNVFFNNTTIGTTTDINGNYIIRNLDSGLYTLVISIVGYEAINREIRLEDGKHLKLDFKLKESVVNLSEILFVGKEDKQWNKDFRRFRREFLGRNSTTMKYEFVNPYVLEFYKDKKNKVFKASANAPLEIINYDLGYKVHFFLRNFEQKSGSLLFYGQTRFEDLAVDDSKSELEWNENRTNTYHGSLHHFFHALIENSIEQEGFMVYKVSGIHPYQRTNTFYDKIGVEYQELNSEDLVFESDYQNEKIIKFQGELVIVYKLKEWINSPFPDLPYQVSWIRLKANSLRVHQSGYVYNPIGYETYGYRSDDRVLQMLPFGYHPEFVKKISPANQLTTQVQKVIDGYKKSLEKNLLNRIHDKLLIHTDKSFYANSDRINISVYSLNLKNSELSIGDRVIYLDLIDPDNTIISSYRMLSRDGLASGILSLPEKIFNGCYRLRAYTGWMREYDPESVSYHTVYISSPLVKYRAPDGENSMMDSIFVNISPEGGNLVGNLYNRIAINATNVYGEGLAIDGTIIDQNEQIIKDFRTDNHGLTAIDLIPETTARYQLIIDHGSGINRYAFPEVKNEGLTMQVDPNDERNLTIQVNLTRDIINNQFIILCQSKGRIFYENVYFFGLTNNQIIIPKTEIPHGITEILWLNTSGELLAKRYVFNEDEEISINSETDSFTDSIGDSTIKLNIKDIYDKPVSGEFAISVLVDSIFSPDQFTESQFNSSYFNFQDQFRDFIYDPEAYMDNASDDTPFIRDNLLITLKDYIFSIGNTSEVRDEDLREETSLHIIGKIKVNDKACEGCLIQVFPLYSVDQSQSVYSDSTGSFNISGMHFYDSTEMVFSVLDRKGKIVNAEIELTTPQLPSTEGQYILCSKLKSTNLKKYEAFIDSLKTLDKDGKVILLEGLTVEDESIKDNLNDGLYRPYGIPDAMIEIKDNDKNVVNVLQYIQGEVPGVFVNQYTDPSTGIAKYSVQIRGRRSINLVKPPLILIDGTPFEGDVSLINPRDIKSIEILKNPANIGMYGIRGANGIIAFNTDKNSTVVSQERDENLIIKKMSGYLMESPIFGYAPDPMEGKGLIYWNANLKTNEDGELVLVLPGVVLPHEYYIYIEGITSNGFPFNQKMKIKNLNYQEVNN